MRDFFGHHEDPRLSIDAHDRRRLSILFLAKHAGGDGEPDAIDGTHAIYHHELRETLGALGLNLSIGTSYRDLIEARKPDYLFTLLNRGGFLNSEMLGPLIATWRDIPHLGASPILRGLGDDKHLMKLAARYRGVSTPASEIFRRGSGAITVPNLGRKMVVKPNASSASWGVAILEDHDEMRRHALWLADEGHDVLFEAFADGIELAVPIIGAADGGPCFLPVMQYTSDDDDRLRTYEEKRGLKPSSEGFSPCQNTRLCNLVLTEAKKLIPEIWPFDYGRMEFKVAPETGQTAFLELNMSCNLWSRKTLALSWRSLGYSHAELVETILAHSLMRQGLIDRQDPSNRVKTYDLHSSRPRGPETGRREPTFAG